MVPAQLMLAWAVRRDGKQDRGRQQRAGELQATRRGHGSPPADAKRSPLPLVTPLADRSDPGVTPWRMGRFHSGNDLPTARVPPSRLTNYSPCRDALRPQSAERANLASNLLFFPRFLCHNAALRRPAKGLPWRRFVLSTRSISSICR